MAENKVVGLRGEPVLAHGEALPEIVEICEALLADAKSGKIVALGVAAVDPKDWCWSTFALASHRFTLSGAVANLQHRLQCTIEEDEE